MFSFPRSRSRLRVENSGSRSRPKTDRLRNPAYKTLKCKTFVRKSAKEISTGQIKIESLVWLGLVWQKGWFCLWFGLLHLTIPEDLPEEDPEGPDVALHGVLVVKDGLCVITRQTDCSIRFVKSAQCNGFV